MVIIVGVSLEATQEPDQKKNSAVQFVKDLDSYYIEPGWVISYLESLPLSHFDDAWQAFITAFCYEPWRCFVVDKKNYSEKKYRDMLLVHCKHYDLFLRTIVVDTKSQKFFLTHEKVDQLGSQGFISIFQYWQKKQKTEYQIFYAFYFDIVAASFNETVIDAWSEIDTPDYEKFSKKAFQLTGMLYSLFSHLEGGIHDSKYAQHLRRFGEVIHILETERSKRMGAMVL